MDTSAKHTAFTVLSAANRAACQTFVWQLLQDAHPPNACTSTEVDTPSHFWAAKNLRTLGQHTTAAPSTWTLKYCEKLFHSSNKQNPLRFPRSQTRNFLKEL